MKEIATVGNNELQRWLETSYASSAGVDGAPSGVNGTVGVTDPTNDKGLTVEKLSVGGAYGVTGGMRNTIPQPSIPSGKVVGLLHSVEQTLAYLRVENGEKSTEVAVQMNEQTRKTSEKNFGAQIFSLRVGSDALPDGPDSGDIASKILKGVGVAVAIALAAAVSFGAGAAAVGLIVSACIAAASFTADVSGGYKALQKGIASCLQKNEGYTKEEADRVAGFISMGIELVADIASSVSGCGNNLQQGVANFVKKSVDAGLKVFDESGKATELVTAAAMKAIATTAKEGTIIKDMAPMAEKVAEGAVGVYKVNQVSKWVNMGVQLAQTAVEAGFQGKSIADMKKAGERESKSIRIEANVELLQEILSECGTELEKTIDGASRRQAKFEKILSASIESLNKINEYGGMA